jgi:hypothetical protein
MAESTTEDRPPSDAVVDLNPTPGIDTAGLRDLTGTTAPRLAGTAVSLSASTDASEDRIPRRRRLAATALCLAATYGLLTVWVFASDNPGTLTAEGSHYSLRVGLIGLRSILAAAVAGLLASKAPLTQRALRAVEYVLFLGLTLLLMASQYFVGLDLAQRGPEYAPIILAFIKDGVIQMMALMMIYGTFIPNKPAVAARALTAMFLGPIAALGLLTLRPEIAPIAAQLHLAEKAGSNILFLVIGAALAVYGSFLVNGLPVQLHQAGKLGQYRLVRRLGGGGDGRGLPGRTPTTEAPVRHQADSPRALSRAGTPPSI